MDLKTILNVLFSDPIWQSIGIAVATLSAVILTFISLFEKQRRRRAISWEIISDTELLNTHEHPFHDQLADSSRLVVLKIWNSGNEPILRDDYYEPIIFKFGKAVILNTEITSTEPKSLKESINFKFDKESVTLGPLLLNRKDSITFKVLIAGKIDKIIPMIRITGITRISFKQRRTLQVAS